MIYRLIRSLRTRPRIKANLDGSRNHHLASYTNVALIVLSTYRPDWLLHMIPFQFFGICVLLCGILSICYQETLGILSLLTKTSLNPIIILITSCLIALAISFTGKPELSSVVDGLLGCMIYKNLSFLFLHYHGIAVYSQNYVFLKCIF